MSKSSKAGEILATRYGSVDVRQDIALLQRHMELTRIFENNSSATLILTRTEMHQTVGINNVCKFQKVYFFVVKL